MLVDIIGYGQIDSRGSTLGAVRKKMLCVNRYEGKEAPSYLMKKGLWFKVMIVVRVVNLTELFTFL